MKDKGLFRFFVANLMFNLNGEDVWFCDYKAE